MNEDSLKFAITGLFAIASLVVAYLAAEALGARGDLPVVLKDGNYLQVIFAIVATIILITPAFCLDVLQGGQGPSDTWLNLYTFAYGTYVVHLSWAIFGTSDGDWRMIFDHKEPVISAWRDILLTIWWTPDLALAWTVARGCPWIRIERGVLQIALAIGFIVMAIASGDGLISALGYLMALAILASILARLVIYPYDSTSLAAKFYELAFNVVSHVWLFSRRSVKWHLNFPHSGMQWRRLVVAPLDGARHRGI